MKGAAVPYVAQAGDHHGLAVFRAGWLAACRCQATASVFPRRALQWRCLPTLELSMNALTQAGRAQVPIRSPPLQGDEQCKAAGRDGLDPGHNIIAPREEMHMGAGSIMRRQRDPPSGAVKKRVDGTASPINALGRECRRQFTCPTAQTPLHRKSSPGTPHPPEPSPTATAPAAPTPYGCKEPMIRPRPQPTEQPEPAPSDQFRSTPEND